MLAASTNPSVTGYLSFFYSENQLLKHLPDTVVEITLNIIEPKVFDCLRGEEFQCLRHQLIDPATITTSTVVFNLLKIHGPSFKC